MPHKSRLKLLTIGFVILSLSPAILQARPFQHKFGELREYHKHWLAVCPNRHAPGAQMSYQTTCWASTYVSTDGFFFEDRLSVARNRTTGELKITFVNNDTMNRSEPATVQFSNGEPMQFSFGTGIDVNGNVVNEYTFLQPKDVSALVAGMKSANRMTLVLPTTNGARKLTYSMIGFTNALKFTEQFAN